MSIKRFHPLSRQSRWWVRVINVFRFCRYALHVKHLAGCSTEFDTHRNVSRLKIISINVRLSFHFSHSVLILAIQHRRYFFVNLTWHCLLFVLSLPWTEIIQFHLNSAHYATSSFFHHVLATSKTLFSGQMDIFNLFCMVPMTFGTLRLQS